MGAITMKVSVLIVVGLIHLSLAIPRTVMQKQVTLEKAHSGPRHPTDAHLKQLHVETQREKQIHELKTKLGMNIDKTIVGLKQCNGDNRGNNRCDLDDSHRICAN